MGNLEMKPKSQQSDEERVRNFQRKLYLKAKQDKKFRFYILYDKLSLGYVLREAYKKCKKNGGSAGIDGVIYERIEQEGVNDFLNGIKEEIESQSYKPQAVKRVYIPKSNGKLRPLGIPTVKDRVVQMACKMVIEPIFEADFEESSYGFRPKKSAHDAVAKIKENLKAGKTEVFDADLSSYFDTIPHKELMFLIASRISDGRILKLIKMWLKAPVSDDGKMSGGKKNNRGTPQGGVISPLLANIYLHLLDKAVKRVNGIFERAGIQIVRYADDFVLMGKTIPRKVIIYLYGLLSRMKLSINEYKSRIVKANEESFDFLGFTFRYDKDLYTDYKKYWNVEPSKKSEKNIRIKIDEVLKKSGYAPPQVLTGKLNSLLRGWINYFNVPKVSYPQKSKRKLRYYLIDKLYRYYRRKSQRKCKLYNRGAFEYLVSEYGLINPWNYCKPLTTVKAFR